MKIAIIDSGANIFHKAFSNMKILYQQYDILDNKSEINGIEYRLNLLGDDKVGHGTSILYIMTRYVPDAEYIMFSAINSEDGTNEFVLIDTLQYINENIECDVILMCAGMELCENKKLIYDLCSQIRSKGTVIISSFSNDGGLTYPAAFDNVIGVDYSLNCRKVSEYQIVWGSEIDFRGIGHPQMLPTVNDAFEFQQGASFATAHIAGKIAALLQNEAYSEINEIKKRLSNDAVKIFSADSNEISSKKMDIKYASVFPIEKETEAMLFLDEYLPFKVNHVLDVRYSGNVGKSIKSCREDRGVYVVESIDSYTPEDGEILIVGHFSMYDRAIKSRIKKKIFELVEKGIQGLYLFDRYEFSEKEMELLELRTRCYYPCVDEKDIPVNRFGKMYVCSSPVIGVYGTGPKQGKFTLQVKLKKALEARKYRVGNLGSEPTSLLFGFDSVIPNGLNSEMRVNGIDAVMAINKAVQDIDMCEPDIILVGAQSQSVPTGMSNTSQINISQYEMLLGTQPDAYFLCISNSDDIEYLRRTIAFLEAANGAEVLGLILFPFEYQNVNGYLGNQKKSINSDDINKRVKYFSQGTGKKVYVLSDGNLTNELVENIEEKFGRKVE